MSALLPCSYIATLEVNTEMHLEKAIILQADSCHNFDPQQHLHKYSDTQSIMMYDSVVKVFKKLWAQ